MVQFHVGCLFPLMVSSSVAGVSAGGSKVCQLIRESLCALMINFPYSSRFMYTAYFLKTIWSINWGKLIIHLCQAIMVTLLFNVVVVNPVPPPPFSSEQLCCLMLDIRNIIYLSPMCCTGVVNFAAYGLHEVIPSTTIYLYFSLIIIDRQLSQTKVD